MNLSPQTDLDATQLHSLLHTAGVAPLDNLGWLRVTGEDRVRWLNGMVTNSIQDLKPGEGNFNFILNAQGRIQGTAYAFALEDSILLQTDLAQIPTLLALFDRFIIMDDVELTRVTDENLPVSNQNPDTAGLLVAGPQAEKLLQNIGISTSQPSGLTRQSAVWKGNPFDLIHAHSPLVPRFEIWSDLTNILMIGQALADAGATHISPEAIEHLRMLEGTPRYGTDIRDKELPQETAQTRALHFAKGCYLGQEIVERIRSRGAVHRTFAAFHLNGPLPAPSTPIEADAKSVGELTSTAAIPFASGIIQIGLGYIRREALDRAASLTASATLVIPTPLPIREP